MITKDLKVLNKLGLHARAAAKVVFTANKFVSDITLVKDNKQADARSIMKILMLSASKDSIINITIDGNDEIQAMNSIEKLFVINPCDSKDSCNSFVFLGNIDLSAIRKHFFPLSPAYSSSDFISPSISLPTITL